jgi:hypothetical protein
MSEQDREAARYWDREAAKAYEERTKAVADRLAETGGKLERWMYYQISGLTLALLLLPYPYPDFAVLRDVDSFGFVRKAYDELRAKELAKTPPPELPLRFDFTPDRLLMADLPREGREMLLALLFPEMDERLRMLIAQYPREVQTDGATLVIPESWRELVMTRFPKEKPK